ncbi:MAG: DUF3857 domain-containing protein [Bacteroidota bacterium]
MKRLFLPLSLCCAVIFANGQTRNYGQIDTDDLKLTTCDFEKSASAMILYDRTEVTANESNSIIKHHTQIKILTEKGLPAAHITILYYTKGHFSKIKDLRGQTLNLENGIVKATPIDKKLFYEQKSKDITSIAFNFPEVKVGSVVEYDYQENVDKGGLFPSWMFQKDMPVKYAVVDAQTSPVFTYQIFPTVYGEFNQEKNGPMVNDHNQYTGNRFLWSVKNVPSFSEEPFATCREDYIQKVEVYGRTGVFTPNWQFLAQMALYDPHLKKWLKTDLKDESGWIEKVKTFNTDEQKIAFIFDKIKTTMKWNGINWVGPGESELADIWEKKAGNSAAINLILYNYLRAAGIKCSLIYASTRDHGKMKEELPMLENFNTMVLQTITASGKTYILDASNKYNSYVAAPWNLLNCRGMKLNPDSSSSAMIDIVNNETAREALIVSAEIKPDGKLTGTVHINSFGYHRMVLLEQYEKLGEKKYIDGLKNNDNNLTISSLKRENLETDSLPLAQTFEFKADLTSTDENYIFVSPNIFSPAKINPFISEKRYAPIDFGNLNTYIIKGRYLLPKSYKIESLPASMILSTKDGGISFRRSVEQADGAIFLNYTITYARSIYTTDEYPAIHDFYKKMFEMLNEQIVLKKI